MRDSVAAESFVADGGALPAPGQSMASAPTRSPTESQGHSATFFLVLLQAHESSNSSARPQKRATVLRSLPPFRERTPSSPAPASRFPSLADLKAACSTALGLDPLEYEQRAADCRLVLSGSEASIPEGLLSGACRPGQSRGATAGERGRSCSHPRPFGFRRRPLESGHRCAWSGNTFAKPSRFYGNTSSEGVRDRWGSEALCEVLQ